MPDVPSRKLHGNAYILSAEKMAFFTDAYLGGEAAQYSTDFRMAPHCARSLASLPPTTVVVATDDPLADEGREYARMLRDSGVPARVVEYKTVHGFFTLPYVKESHAAFQEVLGALLEHSSKE